MPACIVLPRQHWIRVHFFTHVFLNQLTHTYSDAQKLIILHPSVIANVITISSHGTSCAKYLEIYL